MYGTIHFHISRNRYPALFDYCAAMTEKSRNLRNAVLFRVRQHFTSYGKDTLQPLQEEVRAEVLRTCKKTGRDMPKQVLTYYFMDKLLRVNRNPDYYSGLPMQSAQAVTKETINDFNSWLKALRAYNKDSSSFTGKPKMPRYTTCDHRIVSMTNQDCIIYRTEDGSTCLKLPKTKEKLHVIFPDDAKLKEVKIKPCYSEYEIIVVYEQEAGSAVCNGTYAAGIDQGVENIIAFVSNDGKTPILYKGGAIKAMNQSYNKAKAKYTGILMKGHDPKRVNIHTTRLSNIERKRSSFLRDEMHRISNHVVKECISRGIGTLVIGKNTQWKTKTAMSKQSNQTFVQIPHCTLVWMIRYKAERNGITVIEQEESYTSKASFLDGDTLPVYGDKQTHIFSGKRISRGLYCSKDGTVLNADINAALNILRKAKPEAFEKMNDYSFLQNVRTVKFRDLHPAGRALS